MRDKCAICQKELTSIEIRRIGNFVFCRDCGHDGDVYVHVNEILALYFENASVLLKAFPERKVKYAVSTAANDILRVIRES